MVAVPKRLVVGVCLGLVLACESAQASRATGRQPLANAVEPLGVGMDAGTMIFDDDKALRRSYGSDIMKVHECVTVTGDGLLSGVGCPSALVVFGPYIAVPGNANVRFRFDIESEGQISVMSDVLSDGAKQFHGAVEEQRVRSNEKTTIQFRIRLFEPARALETRIGIQADQPANFTISKVALSIE